MTHTLHLGDCRDVMATMEAESVDAIVTDPPYGLSFMGKEWDHGVPGVAFWREALRVLKPGGHLIAFGGSRTYHRLAVAIEDAGFEIRDQIQWIYGSGFPKSLDVSKAMDRQRHDRAQVYEVTAWIRSSRDAAGISNGDIDRAFGFHGMAGHWTSAATQPSVPTLDQIPRLLDVLGIDGDDVPANIKALIYDLNGRKGQPGDAWFQREVVGEKTAGMGSGKTFGMLQTEGENHKAKKRINITTAATDLAKDWQGWGTALKPAHEPAVLARKPLRGTVADTVAQWGTGAINIEGTRVADAGRWPSNVILDEEAALVLDGQSGRSVSSKPNPNIAYGCGVTAQNHIYGLGLAKSIPNTPPYSDSGGASRFFYVAKASKAEREAGLDGVATVEKPNTLHMKQGDSPQQTPHTPPIRANHHPTVKPIALMRYLVRMVTPPGGVVLDPFMGSGSTGCAAVREGFDFVGIDLTPEYVAIAQKRIDWHAVTSPLDNVATMELHEENDA